MTTSDPTPDDHDALLTDIESRIDFYHLNNEPQFEAGSEVDLMFQAATALRTEQSARQAAEAERRRWFNRHASMIAERDALQQRIDAALTLLGELIWNEEDLGAVAFVRAALTESKEPAPKLDPEPWTCIHCDKRGKEEYMIDRENRRFLPRPEFSQNPADYGIEVPHE